MKQVIIYNPQDSGEIWRDEVQYTPHSLSPGEYRIIPEGWANYFTGYKDAESLARLKFRRGKLPVIKTCPLEEIDKFKGKIKSTETTETTETTLIPGGKFAGQKWDDVLKPETFDVEYWRRAKNTTKNIPENIMVRIMAMISSKEG